MSGSGRLSIIASVISGAYSWNVSSSPMSTPALSRKCGEIITSSARPGSAWRPAIIAGSSTGSPTAGPACGKSMLASG